MADGSTLLVVGSVEWAEKDLIRLTERSQAPDLPRLVIAGDELLWQGGRRKRGYGAALYRRLSQSYSLFHVTSGDLGAEGRLAALADDLARVPADVFLWGTLRAEARAAADIVPRLEAVHKVLAGAGVPRIVWVPALPVAVNTPDGPADLAELNEAAERCLANLGVEIMRLPREVTRSFERQQASWSPDAQGKLVDAVTESLGRPAAANPARLPSMLEKAPKVKTRVGETSEFFEVDFDERAITRVSEERIKEIMFPHVKPKFRDMVMDKRGRMVPRLLEAFGGLRYLENVLQTALYNFTFERGPRDAPRILVLGDSIRMRYLGQGYIADVYESLADRFYFLHLAHNVGSSKSLTRYRRSYLRNKPDIVLVNVGLHDVLRGIDDDHDDDQATGPSGEPGARGDTTPKHYSFRLGVIADDVEAYGGRLVLMTSTPVIEQVHNSTTGVQARRADRGRRPNLRFNEDIDRYNEIMRDVARERRLEVLDLHAVIAEHLLENVSRLDGVHLTRAGEIRAARAVVEFLEKL